MKTEETNERILSDGEQEQQSRPLAVSGSGKTYEIDTLEKLVNIVNKDNFERLSFDFISWLAYVSSQYEALRETHPEMCEGKLNSEIGKSTFIWNDDGIEGVTSVRLQNRDTGELTEVKFDEPFPGSNA